MRDFRLLGLIMVCETVGCARTEDPCPDGCLVSKECLAERACALEPLRLCLAGELASSCGNGFCDCGETFADCFADCAGECPEEGPESGWTCRHAGECWEPGHCADGEMRLCASGEWIESCGDGVCQLGCESFDLCPRDCPANGCELASSCPNGDACVGDGTCLEDGRRCVDGTLVTACGDGVCDCGEAPWTCESDCSSCVDPSACYSGIRRWPEADFCVGSGTCLEDGLVCVDGASVPSCGDGVCDCDETYETCDDCPPCPAGTCPTPVAFEGIVCVAPGDCQPSYDDEQAAKGGTGGYVCVDGAFVATCGDGICGNCGEVDAEWGVNCFEDCGCDGCIVEGDFCLAAGECPGMVLFDSYEGLVCDGAELVPSCGNGVCDCEDSAENCPVDCP